MIQREYYLEQIRPFINTDLVIEPVLYRQTLSLAKRGRNSLITAFRRNDERLATLLERMSLHLARRQA